MTGKTTGRKLPETQMVSYEEAKLRRQPKREKRDATRLRSGVTLSFPTLRRWHKALTQALASPRAASTAQAITDMSADIAALLGPAMDPGYVPEVRRQANGYVLTLPDGSEHTLRTSAEAAKRLNLTPTSLRVFLSRGKGTYVRKTPEGPLTLRRTYAE